MKGNYFHWFLAQIRHFEMENMGGKKLAITLFGLFLSTTFNSEAQQKIHLELHSMHGDTVNLVSCDWKVNFPFGRIGKGFLKSLPFRVKDSFHYYSHNTDTLILSLKEADYDNFHTYLVYGSFKPGFSTSCFVPKEEIDYLFQMFNIDKQRFKGASIITLESCVNDIFYAFAIKNSKIERIRVQCVDCSNGGARNVKQIFR